MNFTVISLQLIECNKKLVASFFASFIMLPVGARKKVIMNMPSDILQLPLLVLNMAGPCLWATQTDSKKSSGDRLSEQTCSHY